MSPREIVDQAHELLDGGDADGCLRLVGYVLDSFSSYYEARLVRALAFERLARMSDAADDAAFVLGVAPHNATALLLGARIQNRKGDRQQARKLWSRASETDPYHPDLRNSIDGLNVTPSITHGLLGYAYLRAGWPELAERQLRAAMESDSVRTDIRLALAESLWSIGRLEDCRRHSRTVLDHHPDCLKALLMMAHIFTEIGRTNHAAELLDRAASLDPEQRVAREMYGRLEFNRMRPVEPASIAPPPGMGYREKVQTGAIDRDGTVSPKPYPTPEESTIDAADFGEPAEVRTPATRPTPELYVDDKPAPARGGDSEAAAPEETAGAPVAIDSGDSRSDSSHEPAAPDGAAGSPQIDKPPPPPVGRAVELAREGYWDEAMNLIRAHSVSGDLQAWEQALQQICGLDDAPAAAWETLGDLYMRESRPRDASRAYARAGEVRDRALGGE